MAKTKAKKRSKKTPAKKKGRGLFGWLRRKPKKKKTAAKPKAAAEEKGPEKHLNAEGTVYDRVFNFIKEKQMVKGGELKKALGIDSKTVQHCIEVLEDSELIEVIYPPIGDVRLKFKKPKEEEGGFNG